MSKTLLPDEIVVIGEKKVVLEPRVIRDRFVMLVPSGFQEDSNLVSNYTYLFSKNKSPLSIAIKYSPVASEQDIERQISLYFSQSPDSLSSFPGKYGKIYYRETVTESSYIGIYSLRFAVSVPDGLLFGCFNCSGAYRSDWSPIVIRMLQNICEA